jgi:hypothetical protein
VVTVSVTVVDDPSTRVMVVVFVVVVALIAAVVMRGCAILQYARWSRRGCKVPQVNAFLALPHTRLQWGLIYKKLAHCDLAHARANGDRVRSSAAISLSDGGHSGLVDLSTPADPYVLLGCVCKYKGQAPGRELGHVVVAINSGSRQSPRGSHSD